VNTSDWLVAVVESDDIDAESKFRSRQKMSSVNGTRINWGHLQNHVGLTENFDQSENEEFLVNDSP
jgi:hypothetical protein